MSSRKKLISRRAFATGGLAGSALFYLTPRTGIAALSHALSATKKSDPMMVQTMRGPVPCDSLGTTSMHEHTLFYSGPREQDPVIPIPDDLRAQSVDFAVSLLNDAFRVGIDTIVDLTPFRPIHLYQEIAQRTRVKIVPSTGFYRRSKIPKRWADMDNEKEMENLMLTEVTEGIDGTKLRAGIIKIATETGQFSDWEKKTWSAAVRVQKATGIHIATHDGGNARTQFDFLVQNGATPDRCFLSHVDMNLHVPGRTREQVRDMLISIARGGMYMEVDTFGQGRYYTKFTDLVYLLRSLCDAGFANRIFISIDCNWHWENGKEVFEGGGAPHFDPNASKRTYAYLITDAVPALSKFGFSSKEIHTFLVDNPRRFFCG